MPRSIGGSFYNSNLSISSEIDKAKDFVKGSLKALNIGGSTDKKLTPECKQPILEAGSDSCNTLNLDQRGWTFMLVLTGVVTTLGSSIPVGYNIGVMNTPAHIIRQFCNSTLSEVYGISMDNSQLNILWSVIVSLFLVGGVTGSLTGGWVADRFGRKGAVVINNVLGLIAAVFFICSPYAKSVEMLLLARLIVGLSSGLTTSTIPMYLTEIAPINIRGAMGVLCPLGLTVGVLIGQIMGLENILGMPSTWSFLLGLYAILILPCIAILPFLPESPKYLYIVRGQEERGIKELSRLRGVAPSELEYELDQLREAHKHEIASGGEWTSWKVLTSSRLRLPLLLVCCLQAGQQCSGINAVFYYSVTIFESAGISQSGSQYASIGAGSMNLFVAILSIYLVNHCGRRKLALYSCLSAVVCLVLLCISITYITALSWMPYFSIFTVLAYVFCYGIGLGPIPYFIGSELFEVGPRPIAMAFGSMANWGGNFIVGMTFPSLQAEIGPHSFLIFAAATLLLAVFIRQYLPETKDRDPSEIANMLRHGLHSQITAIPQISCSPFQSKLRRDVIVETIPEIQPGTREYNVVMDIPQPSKEFVGVYKSASDL